MEKKSKQITCAGEKFLVGRLLNDIHDFFDANTVYSKYYNEFTHEDIEFFKKVALKKIQQFSEKFKIQFEFELKQSDEVKINVFKLRIITNVVNHSRFLNFLNDNLKNKQVETYALKHTEIMEYFYESKGLKDISNLEEDVECAILLPTNWQFLEQSDADKIRQKSETAVTTNLLSAINSLESPNVIFVFFGVFLSY